MKKLLAILLLLLLLTACGPKEPPVLDAPEPTPPTVEVTPLPEPEPEPTALSYTWTDSPMSHSWDHNVRLSMNTPVFTGENQAALDVINEYYDLLSGKVLDYAEGDLSPNAGESYVVNAEFCVLYAAEDVLSVDWSVFTTEELSGATTGSVKYFNFNPSTGGLITFRDLFPDADAARTAFVEKARQTIESDPNLHLYYDHWYELADSALDTDRFYYTENGIAVVYSADDLGMTTTAELSWEELAMYLET